MHYFKLQNLKFKKLIDDMAVDVAQQKRSNIKCYASTFSNI